MPRHARPGPPDVIDTPGTNSAAAVIRAGDHGHSKIFLCRRWSAHGFLGSLAVINGRQWRNVGVVTTVIDHALSARGLESPKIRAAACVDDSMIADAFDDLPMECFVQRVHLDRFQCTGEPLSSAV